MAALCCGAAASSAIIHPDQHHSMTRTCGLEAGSSVRHVSRSFVDWPAPLRRPFKRRRRNWPAGQRNLARGAGAASTTSLGVRRSSRPQEAR